MKKFRLVSLSLAVLIIAVAGSTVKADPVAERRALMKKTVLPNTKLTGGMVKGAIKFDAAKAEAAARAIAGVPQKFVKLFPEDSQGDPDSSAKDEIWSDMKGFSGGCRQTSHGSQRSRRRGQIGTRCLQRGIY